ncbi:hypothetical protein [Aquabacter cavernae]|uniref:hypothetical protein n=1 Tax=Aquabacter cavernae TaxID=2496029 RepID=UPI000F8F2790|nr:hypothetical protein [Aquabacter cavernae]
MKVWLRNPKTGALKRVPVSTYAPYWIFAGWVAVGACGGALALLVHAAYPAWFRPQSIAAGLAGGLVARIIITLRNRGSALIARGWQFAEPESLEARAAAIEWRLPSETRSAPLSRPFVLNEAAFLADAAALPSQTRRPAPVPITPISGGTKFMRFIMYAVAVLAFLAGIVSVVSMRSDIQLGMSLTSFIGSFILLGLGHIMGRLAR